MSTPRRIYIHTDDSPRFLTYSLRGESLEELLSQIRELFSGLQIAGLCRNNETLVTHLDDINMNEHLYLVTPEGTLGLPKPPRCWCF